MDRGPAGTGIEATYLAREVPLNCKRAQGIRIEDVYFPDTPSVPATLRARQLGNRYELTKDLGATISAVSLTKAEYDCLRVASQRRLIRDRYRHTVTKELPAGKPKYPADVDVFRGALEGLVWITVGFGTTGQRDRFTPPDYCGQKVAGEAFLAEHALAATSYKDIARQLGRMGYLRLGQDT